MALGSGSSLATTCSTNRKGFLASAQLLRAGCATLLHQVSSSKALWPTRGCPSQGVSVANGAFFFSYSGSGEVIHRLARSQRTPSLLRVARTLSLETCSSVRPSSKLTSAAKSNVHRLLALPNFRG